MYHGFVEHLCYRDYQWTYHEIEGSVNIINMSDVHNVCNVRGCLRLWTPWTRFGVKYFYFLSEFKKWILYLSPPWGHENVRRLKPPLAPGVMAYTNYPTQVSSDLYFRDQNPSNVKRNRRSNSTTTLYPRRGSRDISNVPLRRLCTVMLWKMS
jgi:hypothetical protein